MDSGPGEPRGIGIFESVSSEWFYFNVNVFNSQLEAFQNNVFELKLNYIHSDQKSVKLSQQQFLSCFE